MHDIAIKWPRNAKQQQHVIHFSSSTKKPSHGQIQKITWVAASSTTTWVAGAPLEGGNLVVGVEMVEYCWLEDPNDRNWWLFRWFKLFKHQITMRNSDLSPIKIPIQWPMIINDPNGCVSKYVYPLKWPCQLATWWCRQGAQVFHACIVLTKPLVQLPNCHGPGISFLLSPQPQELSQFSVLNNHLVVSQNPGTRMVPKIAG